MIKLVSSNNFQNGISIEVDGEVFIIVDFQHVKPGKGQAFVRTKLKNLRTGNLIARNFRADEDVKEAYLERREVEYLYNDGDNFYFMDTQNFEQISFSKQEVENALPYLKENMVIVVIFYQNKPLSVEPPIFVELEVTETEPGVKGDTASGGTKPARLETGLVLQVPLFVEKGDKVKVDTRDGKYVSRV